MVKLLALILAALDLLTGRTQQRRPARWPATLDLVALGSLPYGSLVLEPTTGELFVLAGKWVSLERPGVVTIHERHLVGSTLVRHGDLRGSLLQRGSELRPS